MMITKTDVIEEIEKIPDNFLEEGYNYMKYIEFKAISEKKEATQWQALGTKEFFKGYSDEDSEYDNNQKKWPFPLIMKYKIGNQLLAKPVLYG